MTSAKFCLGLNVLPWLVAFIDVDVSNDRLKFIKVTPIGETDSDFFFLEISLG